MDRQWTPAEAARLLFEQYAIDIYKYARCVLGSLQEAEDVVQDTFARVLRGWQQFDHRSSPKTWVWTIARNCVNDGLRRKRVRIAKMVVGGERVDHVGTDVSGLQLELQDAISRLRPSYRQAITVRYIHDLSTEEAAQVLGWTPGKVRTTLHRALAALHQALAEQPIDAQRGHRNGQG